MFSLFTKALDPQKVLKTFPSYHYKSLENTSLLKYTPFYDINLKYNESFDSQILLIPHDKTLPPRSRIYETSFYEYAWKKNKIEGKLSPYFVPEHHLIVAIVEMDKEKLSHQQLRSLLTFATSSSLQLYFFKFLFTNYYIYIFYLHYLFYFYFMMGIIKFR